MTAATVAAPAPEDDDGQVVERVLCNCGRLAMVVLSDDADTCWCSVTCTCGAFSPAEPDGDAS